MCCAPKDGLSYTALRYYAIHSIILRNSIPCFCFQDLLETIGIKTALMFSFESQRCNMKTGSYFMLDKSVGLVFKKRPSL